MMFFMLFPSHYQTKVNKYFDITARINSLMDIILQACGTQEVWPDWLSALYRKTVEHEG
jgi:hypothetical protein